VPGDKSISHRILFLSAIASGATAIHNCSAGDDVESTRSALRALGVSVEGSEGHFAVVGAHELRAPNRAIDCGNSGTTMRLLMGLLAGRVRATLDGDASLRRRPMERVAAPLRAMGARVDAGAGGCPPVTLAADTAQLCGISYAMPVASSQVRSALLLAGLRASGQTAIASPAPCRDHTERMLAVMGADVSVSANTVTVSRSALRALRAYEVPGDFSAAMFFLGGAAVAVSGTRLTLNGVGLNPTRTAALDVLREMGLRVGIRNYRERDAEPVADLDVACGVEPHARELQLDPASVPNCIDEIPTLCALAGVLLDRFIVRGASELRAKESDRIASTATLLRAFGIQVHELPDGVEVLGGRRLKPPARVSTHGDHRIGMTAAVLALAARSSIEIEDTDCIATSFPGFEQTWTGVFRARDFRS
jgi:3-phosphoshikimate 1-carboxyvinyltransferase